MGVQLKISGDPRRPAEVRKYDRPHVNPDEQSGDIMLIFALMFGVMGLLLKVKVAAWAALVCCISSIANMKSAEMDFKQMISSITFAVFGLAASYMQAPPLQKPASPADNL